MNELIPINYNEEQPTVLGRDLHSFLEVETRYADWIKRMFEYGFTENADYIAFSQNRENGGRNIEHQMTIPMAKEICMLQRNEKGKMARQYFIALEAQWNSPDAVMARALKLADKQINSLRLLNSTLTVSNQIMQPKADYFDELVDRNLLTGIRETAKELKIKQQSFTNFLLDKKYLYRDQKGKLMPYSPHVDKGLFELKESVNEKTNWSGTQTMVTPKGRETFRLLCVGLE